MPPADPRHHWAARSSALALRINLAAWLYRVAPAGFFLLSGLSVGIYAFRRLGFPLWPVGPTVALALAIVAIMAWRRARPSFFLPRDARVFLESQLRLDTRLSAAEAGLVAWPDAVAPRRVYHWNYRPVAGWLLGAAALLTLSLLVPLPEGARAPRHSGPPPALVETAALLAQLEELKVADPEALRQMQQKAEDLLRRPTAEQYEHSALAAADTLRDSAEAAAASLARALEAAAEALRAPEQGATPKQAEARLQTAMDQLRQGALPANSSLMNGLSAGAMGSDARGQMAQSMADAAQAVSNAAGVGSGEAGAAGSGASGAGKAGRAGGKSGEGKAGRGQGGEGKAGEGAGQGSGQGSGQGQGAGQGAGAGQGEGGGAGAGSGPGGEGGGNGLGAGGGGGGGGSGALTISETKSNVGPGRDEFIETKDRPGGPDIGEQLGVSLAPPSIENESTAGVSGGALSGTSRGGDAFWTRNLTPRERNALKEFNR